MLGCIENGIAPGGVGYFVDGAWHDFPFPIDKQSIGLLFLIKSIVQEKVLSMGNGCIHCS
jgi:hypothetical protein